MSYTPSTLSTPRAFSAYNSSTQTETQTAYFLEFDTLKNMTQVSASVLDIPSESFFTIDLKTQKLSGEERFTVNYTQDSSQIVGTIGTELSWRLGLVETGAPFAYGLNQGAATTTRISVDHNFSQSEPIANNNRIIGLRL